MHNQENRDRSKQHEQHRQLMAQTTRQAAMTPKPYVKGVVPSIVCEVRPLRCCVVCDLVCVKNVCCAIFGVIFTMEKMPVSLASICGKQTILDYVTARAARVFDSHHTIWLLCQVVLQTLERGSMLWHQLLCQPLKQDGHMALREGPEVFQLLQHREQWEAGLQSKKKRRISSHM